MDVLQASDDESAPDTQTVQSVRAVEALERGAGLRERNSFDVTTCSNFEIRTSLED